MADARLPGPQSPTSAGLGLAAEPFAQRASPPGPTGTGTDNVDVPGVFVAPRRPSAPPSAPPRKTPEGEARGMTASEISMARSLFGDSVVYGRVKVHNEEYLPFGLQPDDTAMTPNGEMYFNPKRFKEDFSLSDFSDAHWFMHEMVHVWQYQLGYPVMLRGAIRIGLGYEYTLQANKRLRDYNMEAQGDLLSDYWAVSQFTNPKVLWQEKHRHDLALFRQVLQDFIAAPSNKRNLPS